MTIETPLVLCEGTGRIIRKDGTIVPFTLKGSNDGTYTGNANARRNIGRSGHSDRDDGDAGIPDGGGSGSSDSIAK